MSSPAKPRGVPASGTHSPAFPQLHSLSRSPSPAFQDVSMHSPYGSSASSPAGSSMVTIEAVLDQFFSSFDRCARQISMCVDAHCGGSSEAKNTSREALEDFRRDALQTKTALLQKFTSYRVLVTKLEESLQEEKNKVSKYSSRMNAGSSVMSGGGSAMDSNQLTVPGKRHGRTRSKTHSASSSDDFLGTVPSPSHSRGDWSESGSQLRSPVARKRKGRNAHGSGLGPGAGAFLSFGGSSGNVGSAAMDARAITQSSLEILTLGLVDLADGISGEIFCNRPETDGFVDSRRTETVTFAQINNAAGRRRENDVLQGSSNSLAALGRKGSHSGGLAAPSGSVLVGDDKVFAELNRGTRTVDRLIVIIENPMIAKMGFLAWLEIQKPRLTILTDILEHDVRSFTIAITHLLSKILSWKQDQRSMNPPPSVRSFAPGSTVASETTGGGRGGAAAAEGIHKLTIDIPGSSLSSSTSPAPQSQSGPSPPKNERLSRRDTVLSIAVSASVFRAFKLERFGYGDTTKHEAYVEVSTSQNRVKNMVDRFNSALNALEEPHKMQEKLQNMEEVWKLAVNKINSADSKYAEMERERNRTSDKCHAYEALLQTKEQEIQQLRGRVQKLQLDCEQTTARLRESYSSFPKYDAAPDGSHSIPGRSPYGATFGSPDISAVSMFFPSVNSPVPSASSFVYNLNPGAGVGPATGTGAGTNLNSPFGRSSPIPSPGQQSIGQASPSPGGNSYVSIVSGSSSPPSEKHDLFLKVFYHSAFPCFILSTNWQIVFANNRFCSVSMFAESELQVDGLRKIGLRKTLQALFLRDSQEYSAVFSILTKKKTPVDIWLAVAQLPNRKNRPLFYCACVPLAIVDSIPRS
eukprot:ANDGO_02580.mRNA.1 hypothetical protein